MLASVVARCGPQLRSPSGGNFANETWARASAGVLIIGAMMPSAPKSSARLAVANSPTGMRTIAAAPPWRTCAIPDTIEAVSQSRCCPSSVTAGKPSRPTSSATIGEDRPHQPLWTVSPARSRRARENALAVVMGKIVLCCHRPRGPVVTQAAMVAHARRASNSRGGSSPSIGDARPAISAARFDLLDRFCHQLVHGAANLVTRDADALGVEVLANLAEDVVVTDLLKIRHDDRLGIGVGLVAGEAEFLRRPQAEELVATGVRLESQFLVEGKLLLEAFLALVERSHACLAVSGAAGRSHRFPTVRLGCTPRQFRTVSTSSVGTTRGLA